MSAQRRGAVLAPLLLAGLAAAAPAQTPPPSAMNADAAVRLRGKTIDTRENLYHGDRKLVGLDQSATEYRADLHLYRGARTGPASVDADEHHARMLALYGGQTVRRLPEPDALVPPPKRPPAEPDDGPATGIGPLVGYALIGIVALGALTWHSRKKPAPPRA